MSTLESYDEIPYESVPLTDTHPDHLYVIGRLFGLPAADPARCRVLELGCAAGGNITPMAYYLPDSRFVGVDLSARQVEDGRRLIEGLALDNVQLMHANVMDLGRELGEFDYIIAHGLYSWVPAPVRSKILALARELLAPHGIAYISYNTRPGWHVRGMVREILLYETRGVTGHRARLARAREVIALLGAASAGKQSPMMGLMHAEVQQLTQASDSYLYHEYLEDTNEAFLFSDFVADARAADLQYLADCELHTLFSSTLPPAAAAQVDALDELLEQEQLMDFLRARLFRKSLLCRADAPASRDIDLAGMLGWYAYADLAPEKGKPDLARRRPQTWVAPTGGRFEVQEPLTKAALTLLAEVYPDAVRVEELAQQAAQRVPGNGGGRGAPQAAALDAFYGELFELFAAQALRLTPRATGYRTRPDQQPRATALAAAQAALGFGCAASPRHVGAQLDAFATRLLGLLDGSRTLDEVAAHLLEEAERGQLAIPTEGAPDARLRGVRRNVTRLVQTFVRHALLAP
ncbi:methyltransferase regulatory domain-containing protein [Ectothiorhodospiraceae bacterium 2226]|nr:methyltransferase regulatory domain-containing protein [Ectothiorhodospiraceae bacterium 2226]